MLQAEDLFLRFSEALARWDLEFVESLIVQAARDVPETFFGFVPGYEKTEKRDGLCHRFLFVDGSFLEVDIKAFRDEDFGQTWPRHALSWGVLAWNARPVLDNAVFDLPAYTKRMEEIACRKEFDRKEFDRIAKEETTHSQMPGMEIPSERPCESSSLSEELVWAVAEALKAREPSALEEAFGAVDGATFLGWKPTMQDDWDFLCLPSDGAGKHAGPEPVQRVGRHWRFQDGSEFMLHITSLSFVQPTALDAPVPMALDAIALRGGVPLCMTHALADAVPTVGAKGLFLGFTTAKLAEPACQRGPWGWLSRFPEEKKGPRSDAYASWIRTAQDSGSPPLLETVLACAFQESVWNERVQKPSHNEPGLYSYSDPADEWWESLKFRFKDRSVLSVTLYGHHLTRHHIHVTEMPEKMDIVSVWL